MGIKVDVCVNFYGKPYQTAVTLWSLWKHSSEHIHNIFVITEREQPHNDYGGAVLLKYLLHGLPVVHFTPDYFYGLGTPADAKLAYPAHRYALNFQYAFEHCSTDYLFITHNDCVYEADLLGKMLARMGQEDQARVAGLGLIGQCWNCPAFAANVCDPSRYESFVPSSDELEQLVDMHHPPREAIHRKLIGAGQIHPLPECRLNEHACLINAKIYNEQVYPKGDVLPLGGNWNGTDTGATWFYQMYNRGFRFVHFPFEPDMRHAPFADSSSGTKGDKNLTEYLKIEDRAKVYLQDHGYLHEDIPWSLRVQQMICFMKFFTSNNFRHLFR